MPVHNGARFVDAAIRSVLEQSFVDFEFLIIDDGSTDRTAGILERWQKRDSRIRILRQERTGIVGALNAGLRLARGKYIARMDGDDVCLPARFERQIRFLEEHPEVVGLGTWTWHVDPAGRRLKLACDYTRSEDIEAGLLRGEGAALPHPTLMARTEAMRRIGGYRREYDLAEDVDLYFRLLECGRLANLPEPLLYYRLHYHSTNHTRADRQWELVGRMLAEQHTRRGLPLPPPAPKPPLSTHAQCHRRWARQAVAGSSWLLAGIHGAHAFARGPFDSRNYYLLRFIASQWRRAVRERLRRLFPKFSSRTYNSG